MNRLTPIAAIGVLFAFAATTTQAQTSGAAFPGNEAVQIVNGKRVVEAPPLTATAQRYVKGGGVVDWGLSRRIISRGGSLFARVVLWLPPHDLTGGFKAWRREALEVIDRDRLHSGGYVFQIEMTYLADRAGARVVEVPIVFLDRRVGQSKMSGGIFKEALSVVLRLRWDELRGRGPTARMARPPASGS